MPEASAPTESASVPVSLVVPATAEIATAGIPTPEHKPVRSILVVNGPNLNLLGTREPEKYGTDTLHDLQQSLNLAAGQYSVGLHFVQSNHEGELIDAIHQAKERDTGIIINPGAFSHTSVAILDALLAVGLPVVEVHITNIHQREEFRHHSYVSRAAKAVIAGAGLNGYRYALDILAGS